MKRDRADLPRMQVALALRKRLRMRQRALDGARPSEKAVAHRLDVVPHDPQTGQLPQEVGHLLHDPGARVFDREHSGIDRAHLQRVERQAKRGKAGRLTIREERCHRLVREGSGLPLVRDLHPKIRCRSVSATWLWSDSWSVTGGWPLPSWPLLSDIAAILRRSSSLTSFLVSASCRNRCHAASALGASESVMPSRFRRW